MFRGRVDSRPQSPLPTERPGFGGLCPGRKRHPAWAQLRRPRDRSRVAAQALLPLPYATRQESSVHSIPGGRRPGRKFRSFELYMAQL